MNETTIKKAFEILRNRAMYYRNRYLNTGADIDNALDIAYNSAFMIMHYGITGEMEHLALYAGEEDDSIWDT